MAALSHSPSSGWLLSTVQNHKQHCLFHRSGMVGFLHIKFKMATMYPVTRSPPITHITGYMPRNSYTGPCGVLQPGGMTRTTQQHLRKQNLIILRTRILCLYKLGFAIALLQTAILHQMCSIRCAVSADTT